MLSSSALIKKVEKLHKADEPKLFIIDDTVEVKRGKHIEGSCKSVWSNKAGGCVNGINIVSLNHSDSYSTFQLDFAVTMNKSRRKDTKEFNPDFAIVISNLSQIIALWAFTKNHRLTYGLTSNSL